MTRQAATFSSQVRQELLAVACDTGCCRSAELSAALLMADTTDNEGLVMTFTNHDVAEYFRQLIIRQTGREILPIEKAENSDAYYIQPQAARIMRAQAADLYEICGQEEDKSIDLKCEQECCLNSMLRAFFLLCGSISEPKKSYHLEFKPRRQITALLISNLLSGLEIRSLTLRRKDIYYVYVQEGQHVADFLLISKAHKAYMDFELLRVEKEMRNSVNRVVNCDSANTQRIADTAARQLQLIRLIRNTTGLSVLPEHLRAAAEARLAYPDLSLKELGEQLNPPIGKSGMNHRLKKIEQLGGQIRKADREKRKNET